MTEENLGPDPIIIKPSRGNRILRSRSARLRRKWTKQVREQHQSKIEKDARERYVAKKRLMRQKRRARSKYAAST